MCYHNTEILQCVCSCVLVSIWAGGLNVSIAFCPNRILLNMHLISVAHCRLLSSRKAQNVAVRWVTRFNSLLLPWWDAPLPCMPSDHETPGKCPVTWTPHGPGKWNAPGTRWNALCLWLLAAVGCSSSSSSQETPKLRLRGNNEVTALMGAVLGWNYWGT